MADYFGSAEIAQKARKLIAREVNKMMDALYDNVAARYGHREGLPEREIKLLDQIRLQLIDSIYDDLSAVR